MATSAERAACRPCDALDHFVQAFETNTYLNARNPNAHMSSLDHADVISTIPNCEKYGLLVFLYQLHHQRLLQGRYATYQTDSIRCDVYLNKSSDPQQITALHMIANSKNVFDSSFSRAKPRLFPSTVVKLTK